ncbi:MAG: peptidoglycan bridge formation glycyltransferase FemA/FemB family protein [Arcanobacterium sp.]|nr:peptidoglycan bridge formation glycyltransferase FemA/FemB family protein [Arcanobacterium sp.]
MKSILQSHIWAQVQKKLGHTVFEEQGLGWQFLAILEGSKNLKYLYCPYGPIAEDKNAFLEAISELKKIAAKNNCIFIRFEPITPAVTTAQPDAETYLRSLGAEKSPRHIQPDATQLIDLSPDSDMLIKSMNSSNRNIYRNIHKKGVTFRTSQDLNELKFLFKYLDETVARTGFNRQQNDYLQTVAEVLFPANAAKLYFAEYEGEVIAAALVYDFAGTRVYAHAGSSFEHRKLSAGQALVANLIMDAKAEGMDFVDLFGITTSDDPNHPWAGFTSFKKSYGGESVVWPGTWDMPVSKLKYSLYKLAYKAKKKLRG